MAYASSFPNDPDTTFVQADPETFRAVVQRLTGNCNCKFNLHERRPTAKKLKITLGNGGAASLHSHSHSHSPAASNQHRTVMASPVSPQEYEERAIAEKGFYFHPNPFSAPARSDPPQLLPLFPLHSPREKESSIYVHYD